MARPHESLDHDTWLWDRVALSDNDTDTIDELCLHGAPYDPDTGTPDCRDCGREAHEADKAYDDGMEDV